MGAAHEGDRAFDAADALVRGESLTDPDYRAVALRLADELAAAAKERGPRTCGRG